MPPIRVVVWVNIINVVIWGYPVRKTIRVKANHIPKVCELFGSKIILNFKSG